MASKKVQIGIDVTANTKGAKDTESAMNKAAASTEKAEARSAAAAERAAQKEIAAAEKAAKAKIREEQKVTKALEAETARRAKIEASAAAKSDQVASKSSRSRSGMASQVGFQVQDIAVQAQAGVAATTILAQQGSQLLGAFGPQGAILGGILAIGAAAAGVIFKIGDDAETAKKKADMLAEAIESIKENAEKLKSSEIDMGREAISDAIRRLKIMAEGMKAVADAEQKFSDQTLQNVEDLRLAEVELRRLRGEDINEVDEAAKKQEHASDIVEKRRQQEYRAAEEKKHAALQEEEMAKKLLADQAVILVNSQNELQVKLQQLEAIRAQKKELEKVTNDRVESFWDPSGDLSPKAKEARATLAATPFDAQMADIQAQIESLQKATNENGGELYAGLMQAAQSLVDVQLKIPEALQVFETSVQGINQAYGIEQIKTAVSAETEIAKTRATEINDLIKDFVPANEQQAQAFAKIKQATSDLQVDASEAPAVAQNLALIKTALTTNNQEAAKTTNEIMKSLNDATMRLKVQQDQIKAIRTRLGPIQ